MTGPPSNPRGSASAPTPKRVGSPDRRRDRTVLAFTALAVLVVDVTSKVAASTWLRDAPVELPGPLDLQLAYNPGAAFGLGSNLPLAVVLAVTTTVAALIAIGAWRGWLPNPWAAGLIVGGAIGNVIDRAEAGTVVDMLHTGWWPTFNLADVAIVCGAMLLAFSSLRSEPVNSGLPGFYADWMTGLLIQALVGILGGVGRLVKRSGCAAAAASRVAWRCSTMAVWLPSWRSAGLR